MTSWPVSLPTAEAGTYTETPVDNKVVFEPEIGPPKERRRATLVGSMLRFDVFLTGTQAQTLYDFYKTTLSDGIDSFTMTHPRTLVTDTFKFVNTPQFRHMQVSFYRATIELRLVP